MLCIFLLYIFYNTLIISAYISFCVCIFSEWRYPSSG